MVLCVLVAGGITVAALSAFISMGEAKEGVLEIAGANKVAGHSISPANLVKAFLAAESPGAKAAMTRFPDRDLHSVRRYYKGRALVEKVSDIRDGGVIVSEWGSFYCYAVALENGIQIVAVTDGEDGRLAVDWKCFSCESEMEWGAFLKSGSTGFFRVVVSRSDYRNFEYADEKRWAAYQLMVPGYTQTVHGYVPVDSVANAELALLLGESGRHRFMMELKANECSASSGQVEIVRCLQSDWVELE
jgi:hypothetical protein